MTTETNTQTSPKLETERLVLRALQMEDADFIFKEWGDPVVTRYMTDEEPLKTLEEAKERLKQLQTSGKTTDFRWWGIELKAEKCLIGTCGYFRWDKAHHRAEIGYEMWPDYWGKGLMPEAIRALIQYGFEQMDLNRIEASAHTENQRSQRVMEKLGFQKEGILREYYCRYSIYNDQVLYSLLKKEWQPGNLHKNDQK